MGPERTMLEGLSWKVVGLNVAIQCLRVRQYPLCQDCESHGEVGSCRVSCNTHRAAQQCSAYVGFLSIDPHHIEHGRAP
jgi:hypothetical protein